MSNWTVSTANLPVFLHGTPQCRVRTDGKVWEVYTTVGFPLPNGSVEEYVAELLERSAGLVETDLEFFNGNDEYPAEAEVSGWRAATPEELALLNAK